MRTLILFDLDGTLTDSGPGIIRCVQYALRKMGRPMPEAQELACFVGPPLLEQFMDYGGFSREEGMEAVRFYRERYSSAGIFENALYPGIPEMLSPFHSIPLASGWRRLSAKSLPAFDSGDFSTFPVSL